ncbi:c-type cytochrome [Luteimonas suaedae]|uniref:c-type cytochrome n=1 Tax=Luteimonas suaedae TaxID=2605430 RepID=UPI0011F01B39|nr:cytochrome c [Luteimonas suaedae]
MTHTFKSFLLALAVLLVVAGSAAAGLVWSGIYDIAADDPHTRPIGALLATMRDRSIERRTRTLQVPDLDDPARILQGAGNYDAMCAVCHLAPGIAETELSAGLYPAPPRLDDLRIDPRRAFWVIKHGIKATGMPAWGRSMEDEYIWNMAAFLQQLPDLDPNGYSDLVERSEGHSHGGGESGGHGEPGNHGESEGHDHGDAAAGGEGAHAGHGTTPEADAHIHTDPATRESPPAGHEDHDHQH